MEIKQLVKRYEDGESINQIAKSLGWYYGTTRSRLKKAGCKFRSVSEGVHLAKSKPPLTPNQNLLSIIDGLMLGDGAIEKGAVGSRIVVPQSIDGYGWLKDISEKLSSFSVEHFFTETKAKKVIIKGKECNRKKHFYLKTNTYKYFTEQYNRWYPNGKKVPEDISLSPISIAYWYAGDGSVGGSGYHAKFCTDGFSFKDVEFLCEKLSNQYGWRPTITHRNRILLSIANDRDSLTCLIKEHLPSCFYYKLDLR